ncbi:DUF4239 domain-containing protein [Nocardia iowensis]|uniref:DUF4239 domain-containing protein n=1 Tax=Nocardia iowensis TaxID=204891 RepID=A0ABX8RF68_NOCIO|nr:DUF4239 domain-containing protein [Nocardia iowensis]QXN88253.1 DUF4239 domain-containing protein [Nocardia iowensis]
MAQELLVALGAALIAVGVFIVGDRLRPKSWQQTGDEASGHLALDLGKTFFTAVLAFVFVTCWQQTQNAHNHTIAEAKGLVDVHWAAHAMPGPEQQRIHAQVRSYTEHVLTEEWALMEHQSRLSQSAGDALHSLRDTVASVHSSESTVMEARSRALAGLERATQARHDRAVDVERAIPEFLYMALLFGAVLVLLHPVLTGMQVTRRSVAMTALLGIVIGAALLAVHDLERPFSGVLGVPKDAFVYAESQYQLTTGGPVTNVE